MKTKLFILAMVLTVLAGSGGCGKNDGSNKPALSKTDYANRDNWMRFDNDGAKAVDIFLVYPTLDSGTDPADQPYVRLGNATMRTSAEQWLGLVLPITEHQGNIFAPLYRQMSRQLVQSMSAATLPRYIDSTPREDIFAAFDYFLRTVNKGQRPFILMGHSQGAHLVREIATTMLGHSAWSKYNVAHVATYAIGINVTAEHVAKNPKLKFSTSATDTGVILSWNATAQSEADNKAYHNFITWEQGSLVTNPVSWTTTATPAPKEDNLPSLVGRTGQIPHYAGATADPSNGILIMTGFDENDYPDHEVTVLGKFHGFDIDFFYGSIDKNIADRTNAFLK